MRFSEFFSAFGAPSPFAARSIRYDAISRAVHEDLSADPEFGLGSGDPCRQASDRLRSIHLHSGNRGVQIER
ncbi:hypothetical protein D1872_310200 [compost metagenome]